MLPEARCAVKIDSLGRPLVPAEVEMRFVSADCSGPGIPVDEGSTAAPASPLVECRSALVRTGGALVLQLVRARQPVVFAQAQPFLSASRRNGLNQPVCQPATTGPVGRFYDATGIAAPPQLDINFGTIWFVER